MAKILVLTQDRVAQVLFRQYLARGFHEVVCSEDSGKLFELVNRHEPHLVVTDDAMPGLSGVIAHKAIREKLAQPLPVLIYSNRKIKTEAIEDPILGYCRKPAELRELLGAVKALLRKARLLQPVEV